MEKRPMPNVLALLSSTEIAMTAVFGYVKC